MRKLYAVFYTALILTAAVKVSAQNYTYTTSAGNVIDPGTSLVPGSQGDDVTASVALPFTYKVYGFNYTTATVCSNGNIQFTTNNNAFSNVCPLPSAPLGVAFHPHWDDLRTDINPGDGIFTSTSGVAPNRIFNIEWRGTLFSGGGAVNFEARLFEGQQRVDYIYAGVTNSGSSASIGVQTTSLQTTFSCNTALLSAGLGISFTLPSNDFCAGAVQINCAQTIADNTSTATPDAVGTCNFVNLSTAPGMWYTFVGNGQNATLSLCGSSYDTEIGVFSGTCGALSCVTANDDFCGLQSQVTFLTTNGVTYYVLVTGFSSGSGAFTLTRTCTSPIPNDLCTGALPVNCGVTIAGNTSTATPDAVPVCNGVNLSSAPGLWYTFVGNGGTATVSLCGSSYDTELGIFTGTCSSLNCVTANDDFCGLQSQVTFATTLGTTYYVLVTGFSSGSGAFTLNYSSTPSNDLCTGAITINCGQTLSGNTACATIDNVAFCGTTLNTAPGVWYTFVGDGSTVTMSLCGSSYDTKIGAFRGSCGALTCVAGNDDFCGLQSQITFGTIAGVNYYILVTGFSTATGNFVLNRSCAPPCSGVPSPGSISPTTTNTCVGNSVTLTLSGYSNNTGLTFQWKSSPTSGGPYSSIGGANSTVYTFNAAATAYYICSVTCTNGGGTANTVEVVVNVSNLVHTNIQVVPNPVCSPGPVTISATVSGSAVPGNYTHSLSGPGTIGPPVVSGVNNSNVSFTVTNIPAGNQTYILTSTDPIGCSKSDNISVTVNQTPAVTLVPNSTTICNGAIVPITGTVTTGAGTYVYNPITELYTDAGATIPYTGTALTSGTIIYAKPTVTRTYTATVTSAQGCSSNSTVTITVNQLPTITVQPVNLPGPTCPGFNVTYSLTATGTGITYQWQVSTDNGVTWTDLVNSLQYSNVTTNTLTINNITTTQNGYRFRCIVSGVCPPPQTSNVLTLVVGTPPVINTQPANTTICAIPAIISQITAVFTVVATGVPAPTIYQWQISSDGGVTWNNLANSATATASPYYAGVFTSSLTVSNASVALSGTRYRVIVTNSCNQSVTSSAAILTVNPSPTVVATDLFNQRICISDTLVPLVGTPTGGFWSGVGVSGFNFVPTATAINGPYILTYTYTNTFNCTNTDTTSVTVVDCPERERELKNGAVIIYPNPNNGHFNIRVNTTLYNYLGMRIYDMTGRLLNGTVSKSGGLHDVLTIPPFSGLVYGRIIPIDLSYLPSGNYLLEIYYDDGIRTAKRGFILNIER